MFAKKPRFVAIGAILLWAGSAQAFRNCAADDSHAWSADTSYTVGELDFDEITGLAGGTETRYNYSNHYPDGAGACHVTYELGGSYVAGVEVFALSATRSNYSDGCPPDLLRVQYPATLQVSLQLEFSGDGTALVHSADNGELLARGSWRPGRAIYKTGEQCSIF